MATLEDDVGIAVEQEELDEMESGPSALVNYHEIILILLRLAHWLNVQRSVFPRLQHGVTLDVSPSGRLVVHLGTYSIPLGAVHRFTYVYPAGIEDMAGALRSGLEGMLGCHKLLGEG
jgi:hypothetical protein